jgi:hypothetical protein
MDLGINVTFDASDLTKYFNGVLFVSSCKDAIPRAQSSDIVHFDIANALPETYEYTFQFEHDGEKYDFSFKGGNGKVVEWGHLEWNTKKVGARLVYHPTITISKDGKDVPIPQCDIKVIFILILVSFRGQYVCCRKN